MYDVIRRRQVCISVLGRNGVEVITGDCVQSFCDNRAAKREASRCTFSSMMVPVIRRTRVAKPPIAAKPLFLRDRANVLIWSVAILDIDDDDVIVGWDVYLLVEGGLRGRILPWYNCTSLLIVPDAG